jgi:predicted GNAT family acetyltransferase
MQQEYSATSADSPRVAEAYHTTSQTAAPHATHSATALEAFRRLSRDVAAAVRSPRGKMEVCRFIDGDEAQALEFLNHQPLRNLQMIGFIRDHGLQSPLNRGTFYGCLIDGRLRGIALVGHWVLLSGDGSAVSVFARLARMLHRSEVYVLLGEERSVAEFDHIYTGSASQRNIERAETQLLFAANQIRRDARHIEGLRQAEDREADEVALIHAQSCLEHNGIDPLTNDPNGFFQRVLTRIRMGRTWILRNDANRITFKTDIATETDKAAYLEAVWTAPDMRGKGIGSAALRDLCQRLLHHRRVVCLFADASDQRITAFYKHVGFEMLAPYSLIRYSY